MRVLSGQLLGAAWLAAVLLAACSPGPGATGSGAAGPDVSPATHDAVFLDRGDCAAGDRVGAYREVVCSDPGARARVVGRLYGLLPASPSPAPPAAARAGDRCPPTTDFLLTVTAARPQGYACMRNLTAPHPGDPGGGGGPRTIAGDCVYTSRKGRVKETPCDGSGPHAPQFRVVELARGRGSCPAGTVLYVGVGGGPAGVGCARRL
ncbi:hypothetical protein [Actinacidiphila glaucinigra]|uniref:Lipoprotein n=1 Tax=Actinacidiphila glaucinigra TaxID=235986 RepID=A0A239J9Y7_9ACTN|nr:hypothetical protein [Actinacidiphila glaucinigra]SNT02711.1 hypothetical protein SAMN05216252_112161 [Actinacidiphila glaucinigra]